MPPLESKAGPDIAHASPDNAPADRVRASTMHLSGAFMTSAKSRPERGNLLMMPDLEKRGTRPPHHRGRRRHSESSSHVRALYPGAKR